MSNFHRCLALAGALAAAGSAHAALVITQPFINFESRAANTLGFTEGNFLRIGANGVFDTATGNATGISGLARPSTGQARDIFYNPSPTIPNFFSRSLAVTPGAIPAGVYQPWNMTFTKGNESISRIVDLPDTARPIGFVNSIAMSGSARTPTFRWTPPANDAVQGYRINIYDPSIINRDPNNGRPLNGGQIVSINIGNVLSYTVDEAVFPSDFAFRTDRQYGIEIAALQVREGGDPTNFGNSNLQAVSRVHADFTPTDSGELQIQLPVRMVDGSYKFDFAVEAGVVYHIDPLVAVGYDYQIGAGDPNFRTVSLPTGIGDGLYDLWLWNGSDWVLAATDWLGGDTFDFDGGGVDRFRVTGIETSAGLDPADVTAFVTSVSFTGSGQFTGTQTPITVDVAAVPEPPVGALLFIGFVALVLFRPGRWQGRLRS